MLETINFRKATYISANLLHYLSFKRDAMKFCAKKIYLKSFASLNPFHGAKPLL